MLSTADVLDHHITSFGEGDLEGILSDYAPGAVLFTPDGPQRVRDGHRHTGRAGRQDRGSVIRGQDHVQAFESHELKLMAASDINLWPIQSVKALRRARPPMQKPI